MARIAHAAAAPLLLEERVSPHVVVLTLNRAPARNAFNAALYGAVASALRAHAAPASPTRALVLAGAGPAFCAGMDLHEAAGVGAGRDAQHTAAADFMAAVRRCPLPLAVAAHGAVVGVGATLLLHADVVFAAACVAMSTPFAAAGLPPEFGSSLLAARRLGRRAAARLLLERRALRAAELVAVEAVEDGGRDGAAGARERAVAWAERVARCSEEEWAAVLEAKRLGKEAEREEVDAAMAREFDAIGAAERDGRLKRLVERQSKELGSGAHARL